MNKKFINPYDIERPPGADASLPPPNEKRIHTEVSRDDYLLVKLIRPDQGTIKNVIGLLWKQLCYELRSRNLTDNTSCPTFEHFLSNCRIVPADEYDRLCNLAAGVDNRPSTEANGGNVGRGAKKLPGGGATKPRKQSDLPGERGSESGKGVGEGAKGGNIAGT